MSKHPGWWKPWVGLIGCFALAGGVLWLDWYGERSHRALLAEFATHGITVQAEVRSKSIYSRGEAKSSRYDVIVRYTGKDGRTIFAENHVTRTFWDGVDEGDTVPFQYLPGEPRRWMLDPDHGLGDDAGIWAIVTLLAGIGIYNFFAMRHRISPQGRAQAEARRQKLAELAGFKTRQKDGEGD